MHCLAARPAAAALRLARDINAKAREILAAAEANATEAARVAVASERLVWEAELLAPSGAQGRSRQLMLAVKDELNNFLDERERKGYQRSMVRWRGVGAQCINSVCGRAAGAGHAPEATAVQR